MKRKDLSAEPEIKAGATDETAANSVETPEPKPEKQKKRKLQLR